ncbi:hypothetical protein BY996DRAFT_6694266 [Phakopsora pachyrhizi]|nr:hypothetical protein BY996DRAFT_6694266 [Phakopsora pachyrhizi]
MNSQLILSSILVVLSCSYINSLPVISDEHTSKPPEISFDDDTLVLSNTNSSPNQFKPSNQSHKNQSGHPDDQSVKNSVPVYLKPAKSADHFSQATNQV